ncbi:unnamed protein product [Echinostoma caproni]|uniref:DUF1758 domain-containing protein n=1 Tax=Echinostoma caproni TaxID=27848 RepID=A0A183BFR4_9TREM|nr:unnamed protein product [Echinostoma caproni]
MIDRHTEEYMWTRLSQDSRPDLVNIVTMLPPSYMRMIRDSSLDGPVGIICAYYSSSLSSARYVDPPPTFLSTPTDLSPFHQTVSGKAISSLLRNDAVPGVRMTVQIGRRTGLIKLINGQQVELVSWSGHVRVHCILVAPTVGLPTGSRRDIRSIVLGSASSPAVYDLRDPHQSETSLEVLLPVSFHTLTVNGKSGGREWSLVELLLNGLETLERQFTHDPVKNWSLMIQVDVWHQSTGPDILHFDWGDLNGTDLPKVLHPGPGYHLLGSTRFAAADLIFSPRGQLPSRWYPLCKFIHGQSAALGETEPRVAGQFVGGIEASVHFTDAIEAKRHLLRYVARTFARDSKTAHCLRRWLVPMPVFAVGQPEELPTMEVDEEPYLWHNGTGTFLTFRSLVLPR